jgi:hypothetical protein
MLSSWSLAGTERETDPVEDRDVFVSDCLPGCPGLKYVLLLVWRSMGWDETLYLRCCNGSIAAPFMKPQA